MDEDREITDPRLKHLRTVKDAATLLGVTPLRVRQLAIKGAIKCARFGSQTRGIYLFDERELTRFAAIARPAGRPKLNKV